MYFFVKCSKISIDPFILQQIKQKVNNKYEVFTSFMKFCSSVVEYNPLHLGHLKHIEYMRTEVGAERIIVIMSGNFTQRGEPAVLDKLTRAREAIIAGADAVIELPTVFAVGNAETFAKGAVKILNSLGLCDGLCFGVESGSKEEYLNLATLLNDESKEYKKAIKEKLAQGVSLGKAKIDALKELGKEFDDSLISSPNNILGMEYTKALLSLNSSIDIFPMHREGDHNDLTLKDGITSATSIREIIKTGKIKKVKKNLPKFVFDDIKEYPYGFDKLIMSSLIRTTAENLATRPDCTEGLENRIKALSKDNRTVERLVDKVTTKRYPSSRIRRILISNFLGITQSFVDDCLDSPLYAKILAVNADRKDIISQLNKTSSIPLITRKSDADKLKKTAEKCFAIDTLAQDLYNLATNDNKNIHYTLFV